jgi:magnesium transporter
MPEVRTLVLTAAGRIDAAPADSPGAGETTWVDIEAPGDAELDLLRRRYHFHPLAVEDCGHRQRRAKFERYSTHQFVVLTALDSGTTDDPLDTTAIRIFWRGETIVTVHDGKLSALQRCRLALAEDVAPGPLRVLHALMDACVDELRPVVDAFEERMDELESVALAAVPGLLEDLLALRRDVLLVRRIVTPMADVARRLCDPALPEVGQDHRIYFRDVLDHLLVLQETLAVLVESVNGAITVHANAVNERTNQVMKILAIVSALGLPWTVIAGLFGMNFELVPLSHHPLGFGLAVVLCLAASGGMVVLAWREGWFKRT